METRIREIQEDWEKYKRLALSNQARILKIENTVGGEEVAEAVRKSLYPYKLVTYLPPETPFITPSLAANTPTKLLIPTTVKTVNGFAVVDTGGGNLAYSLVDVEATSYPFEISLSTAITASANNVELILNGYKNGSPEPGVTSEEKIGTGGEFAQAIVLGELNIAKGDYIEVWVEVDKICTLTFLRTAINIVERN